MTGPNASAIYNLVFLLHILTAIVGFGSTFVWAVLGKQARDFEPKAGLMFSQKINAAAKVLTTPFILGTGATGLLLVIVGKDVGIKFSDTWVSIAFFLYFVALGISFGLHAPNQKAMLAVQEKLVNGDVTPGPNGPPAEVAELQERGQKAAMFGGILHLLFLLLLIDNTPG